MRAALAVIALLLLPFAARAHIGSPNVFFEGRAGPNALRVVIRPPPTLPGVAQVDVRLEDVDVSRVSVQAELAGAGDESAPAPTLARPVSGDARLASAPVWLLRRGPYAIRIEVESARGSGTLTVPLQASALVRPVMPHGLAGVLIALGAALCAFALAIVSAAARRGRALALVVIVAALAAGGLRWRAMDRSFGNALERPFPVSASIARAGPLTLLRLEAIPDGAPESSWETLVTDHGKLMHLFLIRAPSLDAFAHLHPIRRDGRTFESVLPPLPAGAYELYAELTHESGASRTLLAKVALPEPVASGLPLWQTATGDGWCLSGVVPAAGAAAQPDALDFDDSWHTSQPSPQVPTSPLMGGGRMVFETTSPLVADRETSLRFAAYTAAGQRVPLEPYMGMLGHAVVRRSDGGVFVHLHPVGTVSMAAAALMARPGESPEPSALPAPPEASEAEFPYAFPRAGEYRIWVQVRTRGTKGVLTGVFDVVVREPT